MEFLPEALAAFDSRKRAVVKALADQLQNPYDKMSQVLASIAEDIRAGANRSQAARETAASVMPDVAAQGRDELAQADLAQGMPVAGMFVGTSGVSPESLQMLDSARNMLRQNIPNEEIRQATGWFRGRDGKWRTEVSDHLSKINTGTPKPGYAHEYTLEQLLYHPNIYKAYPSAKDIKVRITDEPSTYGSFNKNTGRMTVGGHGTPEEARSTLLHELQHYIQRVEGYDPGGNPVSTGALRYAEKTTGMKNADFPAMSLEQKNAFMRAADAGYRRLGGEVEARLTEKRKDLLPSERMKIDPLSQEQADVPVNEIVPQQQYSASGFSRPAPQDAAAQFKAQLLPYQHPVFDRLYAATLDPQAAFEQTRRLTSLLSDPATLSTSPLPGSAAQ